MLTFVPRERKGHAIGHQGSWEPTHGGPHEALMPWQCQCENQPPAGRGLLHPLAPTAV